VQAEGEHGEPEPLTHTGNDAAQEAAAAPADPRAAPLRARVQNVSAESLSRPRPAQHALLDVQHDCSVLLQTLSYPALTEAQHTICSAALAGTLQAGLLFC